MSTLLGGPFERSRFEKLSRTRIVVGASCFVDDFVSCWAREVPVAA